MQFPWRNKDSNHIGQQSELAARNFLQQHGLTFVCSNYHCRLGEIDLIMQEQQNLVFVEVRYRKNVRFGSSAESINLSKQQKLIRCAEHYLLKTPAANALNCRFDVVAIYPSDTDKNSLQFDWIKDAFQA